LSKLQNELKKFIGCEFFNTRIDKNLSDNSEIAEYKEKFKNLENVGNYKITSKDFKDGIKLFIDDCNWILARPSGTEPLLRIYIETNDENRLKELKNILENT
ncbi:phosphoglucomutase/phosphomannomutase family protein, partial [bacterium]|nr:phosphoglucomutase/phosphomannomutase family protein [bacterium]